MGKRSSVDALPQEVKDWLLRLREQGATYDQIVAKLRELDSLAMPVPSRSALHRHIQEAEQVREIMRRQEVIARAVVKDLGEEDDSKMARGNVAMMQNILMRVQIAAYHAAEEGDGSIAFTPMELLQLSKAMDHLGKAAKDDVARTMAIEKRAFEKARVAAAAVAVDVAQEAGLSAERIAEIRRGVLGLRHVTTPTVQPEDTGDA